MKDIIRVEGKLAKMDSTFGVKPKLVNITKLATENFTHYIDLQEKSLPRICTTYLRAAKVAR